MITVIQWSSTKNKLSDERKMYHIPRKKKFHRENHYNSNKAINGKVNTPVLSPSDAYYIYEKLAEIYFQLMW